MNWLLLTITPDSNALVLLANAVRWMLWIELTLAVLLTLALLWAALRKWRKSVVKRARDNGAI